MPSLTSPFASPIGVFGHPPGRVSTAGVAVSSMLYLFPPPTPFTFPPPPLETRRPASASPPAAAVAAGMSKLCTMKMPPALRSVDFLRQALSPCWGTGTEFASSGILKSPSAESGAVASLSLRSGVVLSVVGGRSSSHRCKCLRGGVPATAGGVSGGRARQGSICVQTGSNPMKSSGGVSWNSSDGGR